VANLNFKGILGMLCDDLLSLDFVEANSTHIEVAPFFPPSKESNFDSSIFCEFIKKNAKNKVTKHLRRNKKS